MALDKLVDSSQLDANLTSVANAIRTKGGTSASLSFPGGFVDAVNAIEAGSSGYTADDIAERKIGGVITSDKTTTLTLGAFMNCPIEKLRVGWTTSNNSFDSCTSLTEAFFTKATTAGSKAFNNCTALKKVVFKAGCNPFYDSAFYGCSSLEVVDLLVAGFARAAAFKNCSNLKTLIFRSENNRGSLSNVTNLDGTPFASGGSGGTIYIPEVMYNHLGDGSSLDYKGIAAWSTLDGYGTITWAKIEGSIYETQYADGTPIT